MPPSYSLLALILSVFAMSVLFHPSTMLASFLYLATG